MKTMQADYKRAIEIIKDVYPIEYGRQRRWFNRFVKGKKAPRLKGKCDLQFKLNQLMSKACDSHFTLINRLFIPQKAIIIHCDYTNQASPDSSQASFAGRHKLIITKGPLKGKVIQTINGRKTDRYLDSVTETWGGCKGMPASRKANCMLAFLVYNDQNHDPPTMLKIDGKHYDTRRFITSDRDAIRDFCMSIAPEKAKRSIRLNKGTLTMVLPDFYHRVSTSKISKAKRIVLDLRGNDGGSALYTSNLCCALFGKPFPKEDVMVKISKHVIRATGDRDYRKAHKKGYNYISGTNSFPMKKRLTHAPVKIIVDTETTSSCLELLDIAKTCKATIIGCSGFDDVTFTALDFTLPNSGIVMHVAHMFTTRHRGRRFNQYYHNSKLITV